MRLDLLEGVRTLQWSLSTHRTHPASRTLSISQPKWADASYWLSGRTLAGCGRSHPWVRLPLAAAAAEIARARDRLQWSRA